MDNIKIDEETRRNANLRVLQRLDKSIIEVLGYASHVVLYEFNKFTQAWEKRNVEGSLFIAKRSDLPRFKLIVVNRTSREDLKLTITSTFEMQIRKPYLIFRDESEDDDVSGTQKIRGIWFHNGSERQKVSKLLEKVISSLRHDSEKVETISMLSTDETEGTKICQNSGDYANLVSTMLSPLNLNSSNHMERPTSQNASTPITTVPSNTDQTVPASNLSHKDIVLDKKSLQLTLMSLLQDDRFLDLIHAQYLKVAKTRTRNGNT
mmetsp:Transcript_10106/g.14286  ORF Transcript_10106/g.14286 Transcript_10106/m.14286 type:complete len:264 (+) Transcript_10106:128-919(+)